MRFKKTVAATLAAVMFAGGMYVPGSFASVEAADNERVEIKFNGSNANSYPIVIGGDAVNIRVNKPSTYVQSTGTGGLVAIDGNLTLVTGGGQIRVDGSEESKDLSILNGFRSQNMIEGGGQVNLTIRGAYDAMPVSGTVMDTANVKVKDDEDPKGYREVNRNTMAKDGFKWGPDAITIYNTSSITLLCTGTEMAGGAPTFIVVNEEGDTESGKGKGSLACYDRAIASARYSDSEELVITLSDGGLQDNIDPDTGTNVKDWGPHTITYLPPTLHTFSETGVEFVKDENGEGGPNSFIQKGTYITFTFEKRESNNLFLQVYSPRYVANEIAQRITRQNGVDDGAQEFIEFAEGDTATFVRDNFYVYYSKVMYNSEFFLDWKWVPDMEKILQNQALVDQYGSTEADYADVVKFQAQPGGKVEVTVTPLYWDVPGHLEADIRFRTSDLTVKPIGGIGDNSKPNADGTPKTFIDEYGDQNLNPLELYTADGKDIIVRGLGQPASIERYSRVETNRDSADTLNYRKTSTKRFTTDEDYVKLPASPDPDAKTEEQKAYLQVPNIINMNTYNGWISGTTIPTVPSEYTILLNMGRDNSASSYAEVNCTSGDGSIVTMTTQASGNDQPLNEYAFGGRVANPNADNPSGSEGMVYLTFTPQPIGREESKTIEVEVVFYVKDANNNDIKARVQPAKFRITVTDSSPNNDARLSSLQAWTDTGTTRILRAISQKEIKPPDFDYTFAPDTTAYSFSLENKYQYVWFTPRAIETNSDPVFSKPRGVQNFALARAVLKYTNKGPDGIGDIVKWEGDTKPSDDWNPKAEGAVIAGEINTEKIPQGQSIMSMIKEDNNFAIGAFYKIDEDYYKVISLGKPTPDIPLTVNTPVLVEFITAAEDLSIQRYQVEVTRRAVGTDATLKSLKLTDEAGNVLFDSLQDNTFEYYIDRQIEIPFKVQWIKVEYEMNDPNATHDPKFTNDIDTDNILVNNEKLPRSEKVWINVLDQVKRYDAKLAEDTEGRDTGDRRTFNMAVETYAEDYDEVNKVAKTKLNYLFHFHRTDPSEVNTLSQLTILDGTNNNDTPLTYTPTFRKNMESSDFYELYIPYSVKRIKIQASPDDSGATVILRQPSDCETEEALIKETDEERNIVIDGRTNYLGEKYNTVDGGRGWARLGSTPSVAFSPIPYDEDDQENTYFTAEVEVWPESLEPPDHENTGLFGYDRPSPDEEKNTDKKLTVTYRQYYEGVMRYPIHIYRTPASRINTLDSVVIQDQDGTAIPLPDFDPDVNDYRIDIPYESARIQLAPTATDPNIVEIRVNERKVDSGSMSALIPIRHPNDD